MVFLIALFSGLASALVSGWPMAKAPDLVRLTFPDGSVCTGFFIEKNYLVTAGHCLFADAKKTVLHKTATLEGLGPVDAQVRRLIPNPRYQDGPHHDIGVVETTDYAGFVGSYHFYFKRPRLLGKITYHAAGAVALDPKRYGFASGMDGRLRFGDFLFAVGVSRPQPILGSDVSIAPNDSGAPMLDDKGRVIGVAIKTTLPWSYGTIFPALTIGNMVRDEDDFLKPFLKR